MLVMAIIVHMLVGVFARLMIVLMAIMSVLHRLVLVLVLMLVFVVAAHTFHLLVRL